MSEVLPVMEQFYTLQGEGRYSGRAAYFIRLGGCDVECHWCDVKESWDAESHPKLTVDALVEACTNTQAEFAVITGGEPTMHNLTALTEALNSKNIECAIETSGTHPLTGTWHWICLSPKKFKPMLDEYYTSAHELKVVINHKSDLEWAENHAQKINENCLLYLQPEWDKRDKMLPLIIDYIKENPKWRLSLQTHKYIDIP